MNEMNAREVGPLVGSLLTEPDGSRRDRLRDFLVATFPPAELKGPLAKVLDELHKPGAADLLRLVEWVRDPALFAALADRMRLADGPPPDVAWLALQILDDAGLLADDLRPLLLELDDLADTDPIEDLAEQLESDPGAVWVPLQALGRIEPDVRAGIVAGLAGGPMGPGTAEFLRVLAFAHDPLTRDAALKALVVQPDSNEDVARAWLGIAAHHPDAEVTARARRWLGGKAERRQGPAALATRSVPTLRGCLVTDVDGEGRGDIVLTTEKTGRLVSAAFHVDVLRGVLDVSGEVLEGPADARGLLAEYAADPARDVVEGRPELAFALLAGCLGTCGPEAPPALRFWIEATVGPDFKPRPLTTALDPADLADLSPDDVRHWSNLIMNTCVDWVDDSSLTKDLARAIRLRETGAGPDPARDAGSYRYLFERRLCDRLGLYARMLLWMAAFWQGAGQADLGRAALVIAWQLTDPAQALPGHPFLVELTTRSLLAG